MVNLEGGLSGWGHRSELREESQMGWGRCTETLPVGRLGSYDKSVYMDWRGVE